MIKIKLKELIESEKSIQKLINQDVNGALFYRLKRLAAKVDSELKQYYSTLFDVAKKYNFQADEKGIIFPKDRKEDVEKFDKTMKEIQDAEIEMDFSPNPISMLVNSNVLLSPLDMAKLDKFFFDDMEEEVKTRE